MLALLSALLLLVPRAPIAFTTSSIVIQQPVEQWTPGMLVPCPDGSFTTCSNDSSLWVLNPYGVPWDADDHVQRSGSGILVNGQTLDSLTYIGDYIDASSDAFLAVRMTIPGNGRSRPPVSFSVEISPGHELCCQNGFEYPGPSELYLSSPPNYVKAAHVWEYMWCANAPGYYSTDPYLQLLSTSADGSYKGYGIFVHVGLKITNAGPDLSGVGVSWGEWQPGSTLAKC